MKKIDVRKRMREVRYTTEFWISPEQREKLIREKLERAERQYRSEQVRGERTLQP